MDSNIIASTTPKRAKMPWPIDSMMEPASTKAEDQLIWFALYLVIYLAFYFFTSPFVGNRELLDSWTPYVYFSMVLYAWLISAAALHTPVHALGLLDSTIKQPISLLFPFFSASFVFLIILEVLMALFLSRITKKLGFSWTVAHVSLGRSFMNVLRNSAAISVACVALIVHCDATYDCAATPDEPVTYNSHACAQIFSFVQSDEVDTLVPASYGGAILIWCMGMLLAITNFILERYSGIRMIASFGWFKNSAEDNGVDELSEGENGHELLPPELNLPMVPWYSMLLFDTVFDLLISLKIFLGRFDMRTMQRALHPNDEDYYFDHLAEKEEVWLDFMADCGDGFNSSYQIARLLAQPQLDVECKLPDDDDGKFVMYKDAEKKKKTKTVKRVFPRGDALIIGGDLAYPHPDDKTYETRLFRCFEYAMKPPPSYHPSAISTQKKAPEGCTSLREYKGPSVFAIPGNHDWFDGLNTFTRYICQRDWLGGWLLPQKTSYFSLQLPHGWWLFGVDLALENDIDIEQFGFFERVAKSKMGPNDAVIVLTHEPRWLLNVYEDKSNVDVKLSYLIERVLKGRVAVRLAGDIHNYMRHSLVEESHMLKRPTSMIFDMPRPRFSTVNLPRRHSFSSPVHMHFPHLKQHDDHIENEEVACDTEPTTPTVGHKRAARHLIISGGGGAFLHPTHIPSSKIVSNGGLYEQKLCYPPAHVSRRYAVLNVLGFRRLNWRFDAIGGVGYFVLVFSMFPRCSVGSIYAAATHWDAVVQFYQELVHVLYDMVTTSHVSLLCSIAMLFGTIGFADCTTFPKRCAMGLTVSCFHYVAAFTILLIYECLLEIASARGALGREGEHTLYLFFSSTLPDFSAIRKYDLFGLASLYGEFMQLCMTIFDVPEMVALHRNKICTSGYESLGRMELWTYYASVFPYFWVLATPVVSFVFGTYLYLSLNLLGCHYNEAFSSLRIASYKNFLRLHFDKKGRLEVLAFGVDKMPHRWCRDPKWSGGHGPRASLERNLPSFKWTRPSYWKPLVSKVDNMLRMDFENPSLDGKFNTADRSKVHLIDRTFLHVHTLIVTLQNRQTAAMVKRKKHDKDKYYNLARQQGYRARSAFKLIQLNKKYDFLSTAKVCIDLCAAPGGWCQVAAKYMPASSIILGIDLLPIRPIRGVKTFQCDITTARCRQIIKQEMQSWQADVVLCDGAPNVGAEYSKDAYVQNELALIALKLAVDVLGRGGTFVSKVFRSQDYNALLWVFKQLFKKVSATKPLSSRNESAEIFVVCEHFLAPHSIDPKLFDPKYVFDQVDSQEKSITIFHPKFGDRKRHREGYDEALGVTLTNECSVSQFIDAHDPIRLLTDTTSIKFMPEDDVFRDHKDTSDEIVTCLNDLKVLGKGDFKSLLRWRSRMVKYKEELLKAERPEEKTEDKNISEKEPQLELTEEEKDALVREELSQLRANVLSRKKREKKKERERKQKLRIRAALGMNAEGIEIMETEAAFSLKELKLSKSKVDELENAGADSCSEESLEFETSDEDVSRDCEDSDAEYDELLDKSMEKAYDEYLTRRGDDVKTRKAVKRTKVAKRALAGEALVQDSAMFDGDMKQYQKMIVPEESSDESDDDDLNVSLKVPEKSTAAVNRWFSNNKLFEGIEVNDSLALPQMPMTDKEIRHVKRKAAMERQERRAKKKLKKEENEYELEFGTGFDVVAAANSDVHTEAGESDDEVTAKKKALIRSGMGAALKDDKSLTDKIDVVAAGEEPEVEELPVMDERKYDSDHEEYDAEDRAKTMALASMMIHKSKAKDLIDASYNRYAWNDSEGLPDWFVDDEEKHYRPQIPIPKNVLAQMKERFMDMATKPLKKVAEARGRKNRLKMKKLKAAKKQATDIANLPDMSTREKLKAIDRAMKGARLKKESKVYVVSTRGGAKTAGGKKIGKGKVKVVDLRMKKDKRNAELRAKRGKKRKR
ncbi:putative calcineurin-like phosphoesterase domain, ApaH type [Plasmopara halstedii]